MPEFFIKTSDNFISGELKNETVKLNDCAVEICANTKTNGGETSGTVCFTMKEGGAQALTAGIALKLNGFGKTDYAFAPAAAYNGNRFNVKKCAYPPMAHKSDGIGPDMQTLITDVPRLKIGENSRFELTSGDMATPVLGAYIKEKSEGVLLYSEHKTQKGYTGFTFEDGADGAIIYISAKCTREKMYFMVNSEAESDDIPMSLKNGEAVTLNFKLFSFHCESIEQFFEYFFNTRYCMNEKSELNKALPLSKAYEIIAEKYNKTQYSEKGYYMIAPYGGGQFGDWQAGWVGGGINSYALSFNGEESALRAHKTQSSIFSFLQHKSGFIYPMMYDGIYLGDDFCHKEKHTITLTRKNADVLMFAGRLILKYKSEGKFVPEAWLNGYMRLADAFVKHFERHSQIGQFIDIESGEILMGKTAAAGIAVGGLVLVYKIFGNKKYLNAAVRLAEHFNSECIKKGVLNGGPGEILQCPDSESAFGLLEGLTELYEVTGSAEILKMAESTAQQASSWCMTYDFDFPENSQFNLHGMKTTGSVFANVQNKHSAPAICTLSPLSLLKLFLFTQNESYARLASEIACNSAQYLSREDKPIISWDGDTLLPGWMCERVNTSDWEGKQNIGGVFNGSCWCEISVMLTYVQMPGVLIYNNKAYVFDSVDASFSNGRLTINNKTAFEAKVKIAGLNTNALEDVKQMLYNEITLQPGETAEI